MRPEILSPAGNPEKLHAAVRYGADAVYLSGQQFGMRSFAGNFSDRELKDAVAFAHKHGVRVYLTVNTMPREHELSALSEYLSSLSGVDIDALIVSDLGVLSLVRSILPDMPLHISTQASTVNSAEILLWQRLGASRVVLARELSLSEIVEIKRNISADLELEVFVHGAMCVSYSGRCLLSNFLTGRDSNRGACTQPCRWNYKMISAELSEAKRPNQVIPIEQEDGETFILSSKDLCMIAHLKELAQAGIASFKIEGRMKSAYYTAAVTNAYKMALDDALSGKPFDAAWQRELDSVSHRTYGTGYFFADPKTETNLTETTGYLTESTYLATVLSYNIETSMAFCVQRNKQIAGKPFCCLLPGETGKRVEKAELFDEQGEPLQSTPHAEMKYYIKIPFKVSEGDILRSAD